MHCFNSNIERIVGSQQLPPATTVTDYDGKETRWSDTLVEVPESGFSHAEHRPESQDEGSKRGFLARHLSRFCSLALALSPRLLLVRFLVLFVPPCMARLC